MKLDVYAIVQQSGGQHTVTFSKSASEEVGDKGLMGLRDGELPTLETYSGSGTYRTCEHNPCLYLHRHRLCANTHACTEIDQYLFFSHMHTKNNRKCDEGNMVKSLEQSHAMDQENRRNNGQL